MSQKMTVEIDLGDTKEAAIKALQQTIDRLSNLKERIEREWVKNLADLLKS